MKTIYLKASTKAALIADIKKAIPSYSGEEEFTNGIVYGHYIGDIMLTPPVLNSKLEVTMPATFIGAQHANLFVPDDFDASIFKCLATAPNNPKHQFE